MQVRTAEAVDIGPLAGIWHQGWHDAHAQLVPPELTRLRTLESFRGRLQKALPGVRVAGPPGAPVGFCFVRGDELYQLFVSPRARGSGVAAALVADAEAGFSREGIETAWLACAIGNLRAAKFYEKRGWRQTGTVVIQVEAAQETFALEVWRYEKSILPAT